MWATGGGRINANDVTINANDTSYALVANNQGKVTFTGNTVINTAQSGIAMVVDGKGSQVVTGTGGSKMTIKGNLIAQNQGLIDLNMTQGSYLKGVADTTDDSTSKLAMTGTTWDMTDSSKLTQLTATNSSINFLSTAGNYKTLQVGNLAGNNANFAMHVDLGGITARQPILREKE